MTPTLVLPFRGGGPEVETERLTSLCRPSSATATLPLAPRPLPPRTQEIPEPAACDASGPRSPASGDLSGTRQFRGSEPLPWPREGAGRAPAAGLPLASLAISESAAIAPRLPMSKHFFPFQ